MSSNGPSSTTGRPSLRNTAGRCNRLPSAAPITPTLQARTGGIASNGSGDYVIAVQQDRAQRGDIVVAGIPGDEATVKTYQQRGTNIVLVPANSSMQPMEFPAEQVTIFGRVVTVMRRL